jgi:hypothetical protein
MKASKCRVCGKVEWNHVCASDEPGIAPTTLYPSFKEKLLEDVYMQLEQPRALHNTAPPKPKAAPERKNPKVTPERNKELADELRGYTAIIGDTTIRTLSGQAILKERKGGRKADPRFIDPETGLYSERLYKRDYMRKRRASKA